MAMCVCGYTIGQTSIAHCMWCEKRKVRSECEWSPVKCVRVELVIREMNEYEVSEKSVWMEEEKEEECGKNMLYYIITNLQNKGLISADRDTKVTLMRTIPRSLFKSYTKDLSLPIFELVFQHRLIVNFCVEASAVTMLWSWTTPRVSLYLLMITSGKAHIAAFQHGFWLRGVQP